MVQINHMKKFIRQEAQEKAEEIMIKVSPTTPSASYCITESEEEGERERARKRERAREREREILFMSSSSLGPNRTLH